MAFSATSLALVASVAGQSIYHYKSTDSLATICASGYFASVGAQLNPGDEILVTRSGTNIAATSLRVLAASASAVTVSNPPAQSQGISLIPTAALTTDFSLLLPPCTIMSVLSMTTTAFTGNTVTMSLGSTAGGVDIVAAASVKAAGPVAHTVVGAGAKFAGGLIYPRLIQTATVTAVGLAALSVSYVAD